MEKRQIEKNGNFIMKVKNFFDKPIKQLEREYLEDIISTNHFKFERIISEGHASPESFWYDQDENEFVILLKGFAEIEFEANEVVQLNPGDYLIIPAHKKHRVKKTSEKEKTFWLTIFYKE